MTEITLRLSEQAVAVIDKAVLVYGFTRDEFIAGLVMSWRDYAAITPAERDVLLHLTIWGVQNYPDERPDLRKFSVIAGLTDEAVIEVVNKFLLNGWMEERRPGDNQRFNYDLAIKDKVYGLTGKGLKVAGVGAR